MWNSGEASSGGDSGSGADGNKITCQPRWLSITMEEGSVGGGGGGVDEEGCTWSSDASSSIGATSDSSTATSSTSIAGSADILLLCGPCHSSFSVRQHANARITAKSSMCARTEGTSAVEAMTWKLSWCWKRFLQCVLVFLMLERGFFNPFLM